MNIAQELKLVYYVSGKNFLESKGVDCTNWKCRYRPTTYGWEFKVFDEQGDTVVCIHCEPDNDFAQITYKDSSIAMGLADILKVRMANTYPIKDVISRSLV